ncbi:MAG: carbohydrate kinase family protein [Methanocellales archaeon]|nr:carbohydrate kinase family protein [Methanocellales archaeon]MDD3291794.1 carbohydrate kinase family protein [Methanocellales archaeon]MDD5235144.1 carbohydrate kinase family protein [Methanocellales archaeon]MDD5485282.1 carbohydrate kinase family protein [Methanocellales archaeon]
MKIAAIGDVNVDLIASVKCLPKKGKQVITNDFEIHCGGCAANFAFACTKLGAEVKLFGKLGDDLFGRHIRATLEENRVDVSNVSLSDSNEKTGSTVAIVQGSERSFITHRGTNATFSVSDVDCKKLKVDLVHLPSFFLLEALQHDYGKIISSVDGLKSIDPGWDPFGWGPEKLRQLKDILPNMDIFFSNLDEARRITGKREPHQIIEKLLKLGIKVIALKMGEMGSMVSDGKKAKRLAAFDVNTVDTTGAGDAFDAGFVIAYLSGKELIECAIFANATAALSIEGIGWSTYSTLENVNDFLRSHKVKGL